MTSPTTPKTTACAPDNSLLEQQKSKPDCKTQVYLRLHGERTTMTVRVLPKLKNDFTRATRQLGLSTCHVIEGLINGWLYGLNENLALVHQSPTINMTLVREVKRVRRYASETEETEESSTLVPTPEQLKVMQEKARRYFEAKAQEPDEDFVTKYYEKKRRAHELAEKERLSCFGLSEQHPVTVYCALEDKSSKVEDLACLCKDQPSCINKLCFQGVQKQIEEGKQP